MDRPPTNTLLPLFARPHVLRLDEEPFWSALNCSFPWPAHGQSCGWRWSYWYASKPELDVLDALIPHLIARADVGCRSLEQSGDIVILISYVVHRPSMGQLFVRTGLLANDTLPIAKLRLMGDQMIFDHADA